MIKVIFRNCDVKSAHVIHLTVKLFDDVKYYNVASRGSFEECIAGYHTNLIGKLSLEDLVKIDVDLSRKHFSR